MFSDREFLHGAAFLRLINYGRRISITHASAIHESVYIVDTDSSQSAILFKVSKKPTSSWSFTLSPKEKSALDILPVKYPGLTVFIALICHKDGICCIAEDRIRSIMDRDAEIDGQHISVSRQGRGSYHISGPNRNQMERAVPQSDWPRVVFSNPNSSHE